MASLKVVKKWENLFSCELEKVIEGRKDIKLKAQKQNNINQRFFMQLDLWNMICKKRQPCR